MIPTTRFFFRQIATSFLVFFTLCINIEAQSVINSVQMSAPGNRIVKGVVFDENKEPLMGATVYAKGTNIGTVTGANGEYTLSMPDGVEYVVVNYVGMNSFETKVSFTRPVNIYLSEDTELLSEVVVTGYQTISKERTTGSFDKVGQDILSNRPTADLSNALQGVVAGMQATENADGTVDFLIRGTSSLYANTSPLIVVDGFPIEGSFSNINPNDVESVTVLKDAAAASIWGARSANGVIVITTKSGKKGKLKVDVQGFLRFTSKADIDYIAQQADSREFVDYEIKGLQNGWSTYEYSPGFGNLYDNSLTLAQELYFKNKYYGLSDDDMNEGLERLRNTSNRSQLKKYLMQPAVLQQYNATLSGGTDHMDNYLSLMYENNAEQTIKRGYERFLFNYKTNFRVNKIITLSAGAMLQKRNKDFSGVTVSEFAKLSPYELLKNEDGTYADNLNTYSRLELDKLNLSKLPYDDLSYNMLQEVENRSYHTKSTNYRVQFGLDANIVKGLTLNLKYQYEGVDSNTRQYDNENTFFTREVIDYWTTYDSTTGNVGVSSFPKGGIVRTNDSKSRNSVFRSQLSYSNTFGKHDLTALAGFEASEYVTKVTTNPWAFGYSEESNTVQAPNNTNPQPTTLLGYGAYLTNFYNDGMAAPIYTYYIYNDRTDRYLSYFGNASYIYDGKYGVSFSVRSDGSNYVSDDASLRWSPMWSIGAKWNVHQEAFMADTDKWLNRLALRLTYGTNGNAEKSSSPLTLINLRYDASVKGNVAGVSSMGNPRLRWETTHTTNVGIDFALFNNVLSGKLDYYYRDCKDVIGRVTIPSVYGATSQMFNNAEIVNKGIELELTASYKIRSINLGLTSTVTFSYNDNVIKKLYMPAITAADLVSPSTFVEGKPIGSIYSYEYAGQENGMPYVYVADGQKSPMNVNTARNANGLDFMIYSGTTVSPYTFGWANQFAWRNLSLYVFVNGMFGGKFRQPVSGMPIVGYSKTSITPYVKMLDESDGSEYPTWANPGDLNTELWGYYMPYLSNFIESASYVRLKEMTLSYHFPQSILGCVGLTAAKLFVQGRDLGLLYTANKHGYDPEWLPGTLKPAASVALGVNVSF